MTMSPENLEIVSRWQEAIVTGSGVKFQIALRILLQDKGNGSRISLKQIKRQFAEGFVVSAISAEQGDRNIGWGEGEPYSIQSSHAGLLCETARDPEDGGYLLVVRGLETCDVAVELPTGPRRVVCCIEFNPIATLHFPPWANPPEDHDVAKELREHGAQIFRHQQWISSRDGNAFSIQTWNYHLDLLACEIPGREPMHYLVQRVRRLKTPRNPALASVKSALFLDGSCFQIEQQLTLTVSPDLLNHDGLVRREFPRRDNRPHKSSGEKLPGSVYSEFRVRDFERATALRYPTESEVAGLEPRDDALAMGPGVLAGGYVALDYPWSYFDLTIIALPLSSLLTGRPYLYAVRVRKRPGGHALERLMASAINLPRGSLHANCGIVVEIPTEIDGRLWKQDGEPPTSDEVLKDLADGYSLERFANPLPNQTGMRLMSRKFHLIVRVEEYLPREPRPGVPVRVVLSVKPNRQRLRMNVRPELERFRPTSRPEPDGLVYATPKERVEGILSAHYRFANSYSQLLDYRNSGMNSSGDRALWKVNAVVCGFHDRTGRSYPDVPERIRNEISSEKARILVRLHGVPGRGVFIDGCPVEIIGKDGTAIRYSVEVASQGLLLLLAERKRGSNDKDVNPDDFLRPYTTSESVVLYRRIPQQNANLRRQIDDLRKGRNLAASQEVFARMVTMPHRLEGQFEPAKDIDELLAKLERRVGGVGLLNKEQKTAVSRAARSPHAYFIKGPPGTGKTQVISELIKLLAARGERILLTSAQNKPLAEAIDRLAGADGVVATRITNKLREDLSDIERESVWDNRVETLREGLIAGGAPASSLTEQEQRLRSRWLYVTGLDRVADDDDTLLTELIEDCLSDINLYAVNINAIAARLQRTRTDASDQRRSYSKVEPDFRAAFDTLIVDEASRVNDAEFVTAALRCRRWILVGDERQLPPFVDDNDSCYFHALCALFVFERYMGWRKTGFAEQGIVRNEEVGKTTLLRDAVELVENLWLSEAERQPFAKDKVYDLAEELLRQKALRRQQDGTWSASSRTSRHEHERPLGQRIFQLANLLMNGARAPAPPSSNADLYLNQEYVAERKRFLNMQVQQLHRAFSTFIMRSFFERGYSSTGEVDPISFSQSVAFRTTLKTQYRMVQEIAELVSEAVYDNHYLTPEPAEGRDSVKPLLLNTFPEAVHFVDLSQLGPIADCTKVGTGYANACEAEHIVEILKTLGDEMPLGERISVMVLSIYKKQTNLIERRVKAFFGDGAREPIPTGIVWPPQFSNVDGVQGSEADLVIISLVRVAGEGLPDPKLAMFLQDMRRLNVAITRAKRKVIFVGHGTTIENLCGDRDASRYLAWLLLPTTGIKRHLPYRLGAKRLREAKDELDRTADVDLMQSDVAESDLRDAFEADDV
ncbi:AAA domain-containing protein [Neorhizobium tomejilense]|uniref:AAA domain-containing protein n=1 Tax=Neorhizobium tomejilense TaxID=2093828 RepID=UPI000CF8C493|nr:AAA domain-containing protein [Neorhizobium tomejilense]